MTLSRCMSLLVRVQLSRFQMTLIVYSIASTWPPVQFFSRCLVAANFELELRTACRSGCLHYSVIDWISGLYIHSPTTLVINRCIEFFLVSVCKYVCVCVRAHSSQYNIEVVCSRTWTDAPHTSSVTMLFWHFFNWRYIDIILKVLSLNWTQA